MKKKNSTIAALLLTAIVFWPYKDAGSQAMAYPPPSWNNFNQAVARLLIELDVFTWLCVAKADSSLYFRDELSSFASKWFDTLLHPFVVNLGAAAALKTMYLGSPDISTRPGKPEAKALKQAKRQLKNQLRKKENDFLDPDQCPPIVQKILKQTDWKTINEFEGKPVEGSRRIQINPDEMIEQLRVHSDEIELLQYRQRQTPTVRWLKKTRPMQYINEVSEKYPVVIPLAAGASFLLTRQVPAVVGTRASFLFTPLPNSSSPIDRGFDTTENKKWNSVPTAQLTERFIETAAELLIVRHQLDDELITLLSLSRLQDNNWQELEDFSQTVPDEEIERFASLLEEIRQLHAHLTVRSQRMNSGLARAAYANDQLGREVAEALRIFLQESKNLIASISSLEKTVRLIRNHQL